MTAPIHIIGGGLAGLGLGRMLARAGISVTVKEAGRYPRHKVCGEFISGLPRTVIEQLALDPPLEQACRLRSVAWFRGDRTIARWRLPEPALGISRYVLDQRLAREFVEAGGILRENRRVSLPDASEKESRPGLVQSTGRLATPRARPSWMGLKQHFRHCALAADLEIHLFSGGYLGLGRIEAEAVNVCGLFPTAILKNPRRWIQSLPDLGMKELHRRLCEAEPVAHSSCAIAALDFSRDPENTGWIRLGDSAGMTPPFTGHGMTLALTSAALAFPLVLSYARGDATWADTVEAVNRQRRKEFRRRLFFARRLHPLLCHPLSQSLLAFFARRKTLPFLPLYHLTHA